MPIPLSEVGISSYGYKGWGGDTPPAPAIKLFTPNEWARATLSYGICQ